MDRYGRRPVLLLGSLVNIVACAAYVGVTSVGPFIYFVRMLHGVGEAALFSVTFTIAGDLAAPRRRAHAIAIFGISGMLPMAIAGFIGDVVVKATGYREMFVLATVFGVLALLCGLPLPESRPKRRPGAGGGDAAFATLITAPRLLPIWTAGFGFALGVSSYFSFIKTFVGSTGAGGVATFFGPYVVSAVVVRVLFSWVPDRFGLSRTLLPSMLAVVLGLYALASTSTPFGLGVAGAVCGLGHGYVFPILAAMTTVRAPEQQRGAAIALYTALFDLGLLVGSPMLGAVLRFSSYPVMFGLAAAIVLVATVAFVFGDLRTRPGPEEAASA